MYDTANGKFTSITVAYNSFTNTKPDGTVINTACRTERIRQQAIIIPNA